MFLATSLFLVSCNSDDDSAPNTPLGAYDNGLFVLNEGNSNPSSASITFVGNNGNSEQDAYTNVNPTATGLGSYLQSIFFDDTRAFIISGSANQVTVVNRYTLEHIATVNTNFNNPRYGAVLNGKAYVTNYATDYSSGADDFLTVIDLSTYATSQIAMNNWSEKIIEENGKLYIQNGYYGNGTSITVFDPATSVSEVIELGFSPNSLEEEDGTLFVLGGEKLAKINLSNNQIIGTPIVVSTASYPSAKNLTIEDNKMYYTENTSVYTMNLSATTAPTAPLFSYTSTSLYGGMYGFAVNDGKIYVAEGGNFASDSEVYIYSMTGTLLDTIAVGVGPNGFYFND